MGRIRMTMRRTRGSRQRKKKRITKRRAGAG